MIYILNCHYSYCVGIQHMTVYCQNSEICCIALLPVSTVLLHFPMSSYCTLTVCQNCYLIYYGTNIQYTELSNHRVTLQGQTLTNAKAESRAVTIATSEKSQL